MLIIIIQCCSQSVGSKFRPLLLGGAEDSRGTDKDPL